MLENAGASAHVAERAVAAWVDRAVAERPDAVTTRLSAGELDAGSLAEAAGGSLFASATVVVVTELADLPGPAAHEPWLHGGAPGYPEPVVDHAAERKEALQRWSERAQ